MNLSHPALLFDLGETLFEPLAPKYGHDNLKRCLSECGLDPLPSDLHECFNTQKRQVSQDFVKKPFYLHQDLIAEAFRQTCKHYSLKCPENVVVGYCRGQREAVIRHLSPRPDAIAVVQQIRAAGRRVGIVSNIDENWLNPLVKRWNLADNFELILSSEAAKSCKPDQGIFLKACNQMSVKPQDVVFVGDDAANDIRGANNVGMTSVLLSQSDVHVATEANYQITSLKEILKC